MSKVKPTGKYDSTHSGRIKSMVVRPVAIPSPLSGRSSPNPLNLQNSRPLKSEATHSIAEQIEHSNSQPVSSSQGSEMKLEVDNSSTITTFLSDEPIGPSKSLAPTSNSSANASKVDVPLINAGSSFGTESRTTMRKLPPTLFGPPELSLENVLLPVEMLSLTPSMKDGLDIESETDLRILGCDLIQTSGILLKLPQVCSSYSLDFNFIYFFKF